MAAGTSSAAATHALDATEESLGISTYHSKSVTGFSAVLKARYSDFVVHEVGLDGRIARLDSMEPQVMEESSLTSSKSEEQTDSRKRKQPPDDAAPPNPDWTQIKKELEAFVGETSAQQVIELLQQETPTQEYVELPPCSNKETRRELHQWIRSRLDHWAKADTIDNEKSEKIIRIWHKQFETKMPNYGKFARQPNNRSRTTKKYLQFVLYKENMDTGGAMNQIQKRFRRLRMGHAGMKDKRGITSQFITVPSNTSVSSLSVWNRSNQQGGGHTQNKGVGVIRVGHFEYVSEELRLGRLQGNRFDVVLRNVEIDTDLASTKANLEKAAQALKQHGFINYFGVQRFGKFHDTHLTGLAILQGDYEKAIDIIMEPKPDEKENVANARRLWQERFKEGEDRAAAERECAKKIVKSFGRFMQSEVAILNSLARHPLDYNRAFSCISKTMRMMFIHALQSYLWNHVASYRIEKMGTQVLKGDLVQVDAAGANGNGQRIPTVRVVTNDDITADRYSLADVVLPLVGSKTQDPENESGNLFDTLLEEKGVTREMIGKIEDRDFNCAGDYRKLLCQPTDVDFDILEYTDPLQPLLQTDLMKLNGIEVETAEKKSDGEKLLAMIVGFTLPSSSYATIALRELMKKPTSGEYQSGLKLDRRES